MLADYQGIAMTRIFNGKNCLGASVYDVDTKAKLMRVMSVDIDSGEVVIAQEPLRVVGDEVATDTVHYRAIHPIYGGRRTPQLFHCYYRK